MSEALKNAGRPIVFSFCQYGLDKVWEWGPSAGANLWRTTGDIEDTWRSMSRIGFDRQAGLESYASPGHWNDPDMLEIGNDGMSDIEYRTHLSLWAMLAAPLLAGNDLRHMTDETKAILTNREVIAIDQDPLGKQGYRISKAAEEEIWVKPLAGGSLAVGLFNRGERSALMTVNWSDVQLKGKLTVRDLWAHLDRGKVKDQYVTEVPAHGAVLIRVSK
jgi:alpha-galactosidase